MAVENNNNGGKNSGDKKKIYFLIVVIVILAGINGYLYFKGKQQDQQYTTVNVEKDRLKLEVEKIEVELDRVNNLNTTLNQQLTEEQEVVRQKIAELKRALQKGVLTEKELKAAKDEISTLREYVANYNKRINELETENSGLKTQRDSLKTSVAEYSKKTEDLTQENRNLNQKVKVGAALKAANVKVTAFKVKSNGKVSEMNRASATNKFAIDFEIIPNELAEKGYHKVYLRVIDPAGNLIADDANIFEAEGQQMQYSKYTEVSYGTSDNYNFKIDWVNPAKFIKGTYSVFLYADGYLMGKSTITLK